MIAADAPVEVFDEIDSTMLEARRRAERRAFGPVWIQALQQSAGRGRRGRAWVSVPGNLYVTYFAPATRAPTELALIGFAAGLALCDCIDATLSAPRARLKWPNDVLIDGAKISGLMLDSGADAETNWFALGIGVNLATAPEGLDQKTTSIAALNAPVALAPFFASLRERLAHWDEALLAQGFEPLRRAWLARAHGLGLPIRVMQGESAIDGRFAGLSSRGELELDTGHDVRLIAAGDVLLPSAT